MDYARIKQLDPGGDAAAAAASLTALTENRPRHYRATTRSLMSDLGPVLADTILGKLETAAATSSVLARSLSLLEPAQGGLELNNTSVQMMLHQLVAGLVLTPEEGEALIALALEEFPVFSLPVSAGDVMTARAY